VSNTTSNTEYTWTPVDSGITADVLMVAGGGGGGTERSGGGGAGGLVFSGNESISGQQIIVVGNGGLGGTGTNIYQNGNDGNDSSAFGYTGVGGGGGGGNASDGTGNDGRSGGSGGGGSKLRNGAASTQNTYSGKGFGNAGGNGAGYFGGSSDGAGGGGGGAGNTGSNAIQNNAGDGGDGKNYSSIFGTKYGDNGYFAGGGGGGYDNRGTGTVGSGGIGGGGDGGNNNGGNSDTLILPETGSKHTGGGGGGTGFYPSVGYFGAAGGSGIVLMKQTAFLFPITFADGWVPTDGPTAVALGSGYTLPTASSALTFTVSGSDTFDPDTTGSYTVEYIHTTSTGLVKKVTRVFNVPTVNVYEFYVSVDSSFNNPSYPNLGFVWTEISSTTTTFTESMISLNSNKTWYYTGGSTISDIVLDGDTTETGGYIYASISTNELLFTITLPVYLEDVTIHTHRPTYFPGFRIDLNGTTIHTDTANGGSGDTPSPYGKTYTFSQ